MVESITWSIYVCSFSPQVFMQNSTYCYITTTLSVMCLPLVLLCSSGDSKANLRSNLSPALEKENALCLSLKKNLCCDKLWGSLPSCLVSVQPLFPSRVKQRLEGRCGRSRLQPGALRPGQQEDWKSGLVGSLGRLSKAKTTERIQQLDKANHCPVRLLRVNLNEITHIEDENKSYFSKRVVLLPAL